MMQSTKQPVTVSSKMLVFKNPLLLVRTFQCSAASEKRLPEIKLDLVEWLLVVDRFSKPPPPAPPLTAALQPHEEGGGMMLVRVEIVVEMELFLALVVAVDEWRSLMIGEPPRTFLPPSFSIDRWVSYNLNTIAQFITTTPTTGMTKSKRNRWKKRSKVT